jgi:uncharacterized protein (TIGR02466 family)
MQPKVYQVFPQAVMKFKMDREFTKEEIEFFEKAKSETKTFPGSDRMTKDKFILEQPKMKGVKDFIQKSLEHYFNDVHSPASFVNVKPYITQSWINYLDYGTRHASHTHSNSFLSGVLYINANKNVDAIEFIKPDYQAWSFEKKEFNDFNSPITSIKVDKYELVIFPSSMVHCVPQTTNRETRVSLAFNTFLKGEFGDKNDHLNYLSL